MKFILTTSIPFICMLFVSCQSSVSEAYKQNAHTNSDTFLSELKEGDILFHTSTSSQSRAIQSATHSVYSHCGLLFHKNSNDKSWYVLEAVQPVKWTPLHKWIARGKAKHVVIKRAAISIKQQDAIKNEALKFLGKNYDYTFEWSENKIYCSELVWKAYFNATGIKLGSLQPLSSLDLKNKQVSKKLKERYGNKIPYTEKVISPNAIFTSDKLTTVYYQ